MVGADDAADREVGDRRVGHLDSLAHLSAITILQLIYQQKAYEGDSKDYDFSSTSMREHWMSGLEDTRRTLLRRDWLAMPTEGIVVHDVHRERDYWRCDVVWYGIPKS